jgi:hypothetical protein
VVLGTQLISGVKVRFVTVGKPSPASWHNCAVACFDHLTASKSAGRAGRFVVAFANYDNLEDSLPANSRRHAVVVHKGKI